MKVALVAPPFGMTGGPEVVCFYLAHSLAKIGCDITLFAPGDWDVSLKHIHTLPRSLWNMQDFSQQTSIERRNLIFESQLVPIKYQNEFDIIHLHSQRYAYSVARFINIPCILTLHNRIAERDYQQLLEAKIRPVALSRKRVHEQNVPVITNGIPLNEIEPSFKVGQYLLFIGRITEQKGLDIAIQVAEKTKKKLLIFGRVGNSPERNEYFQKKIKPRLNSAIIFGGELSRERIFEHMRNAEAVLMPIQSKLSIFPLVAMEALACGTPIIGSKIEGEEIPESIGCLSEKIEDIIHATKSVENFDRKKCREYAQTHFDIEITAKKYRELYQKILQKY